MMVKFKSLKWLMRVACKNPSPLQEQKTENAAIKTDGIFTAFNMLGFSSGILFLSLLGINGKI